MCRRYFFTSSHVEKIISNGKRAEEPVRRVLDALLNAHEHGFFIRLPQYNSS